MKQEDILKHPKIVEIIKKLNLNSKQIESGLNIFEQIILEETLKKKDYITDVEIYNDESVVPVTIPNQKIISKINHSKFHWLSNITKINETIKFDTSQVNEHVVDINKTKPNVFYWSAPKAGISGRDLLASWFKKWYKAEFRSNSTNVKGFYLHGGFGLGKTTFASAFVNYLIDKNKSVVYVSISDLIEKMKEIFKDSSSTKEILNSLKEVDILIFDNLGSEAISEWFLSNVFLNILEYRLQQKKITCFISNLNLKELEKYYSKSKMDKNIVYRLIDKIDSLSEFIQINGKKINF